jgi:hypothetical protein
MSCPDVQSFSGSYFLCSSVAAHSVQSLAIAHAQPPALPPQQPAHVTPAAPAQPLAESRIDGTHQEEKASRHEDRHVVEFDIDSKEEQGHIGIAVKREPVSPPVLRVAIKQEPPLSPPPLPIADNRQVSPGDQSMDPLLSSFSSPEKTRFAPAVSTPKRSLSLAAFSDYGYATKTQIRPDVKPKVLTAPVSPTTLAALAFSTELASTAAQLEVLPAPPTSQDCAHTVASLSSSQPKANPFLAHSAFTTSTLAGCTTGPSTALAFAQSEVHASQQPPATAVADQSGTLSCPAAASIDAPARPAPGGMRQDGESVHSTTGHPDTDARQPLAGESEHQDGSAAASASPAAPPAHPADASPSLFAAQASASQAAPNAKPQPRTSSQPQQQHQQANADKSKKALAAQRAKQVAELTAAAKANSGGGVGGEGGGIEGGAQSSTNAQGNTNIGAQPAVARRTGHPQNPNRPTAQGHTQRRVTGSMHASNATGPPSKSAATQATHTQLAKGPFQSGNAGTALTPGPNQRGWPRPTKSVTFGLRDDFVSADLFAQAS